MKKLSRREEQILLAVWNLRERAYLLSIKKYLSEVTGLNRSVGAIHKPLRILERTGYLTADLGEATAKRGGRRKRIYTVTDAGLRMLDQLQQMHDILWADFRGIG